MFYSYEVIDIQQYFSFLTLYMNFPKMDVTQGIFLESMYIVDNFIYYILEERASSNTCIIIPPQACLWCDTNKFNLVTWAFLKPGNISFLQNYYAAFQLTGWTLWGKLS